MDEYPMICTELPGNGLARASVGFTCFWPRTTPLYAPSFAALLGRAKGVSSVFEAVDRAGAVQVRRRLRPEPRRSRPQHASRYRCRGGSDVAKGQAQRTPE